MYKSQKMSQPSYKYLITGGLGYIGAHIVLTLLKNPTTQNVVIFDSEINAYADKLMAIQSLAPKNTAAKIDFNNVDLQKQDELTMFLNAYKPHMVIHLAGLKSVAQSAEWPIEYYNNNLLTTMNLITAMSNSGIKNLIFSSSATVYGSNAEPPFTETMPTGTNLSNPYARTKFFIEEYLKDIYASNPTWWNISILRYFNPIGALHPTLKEQNKPLNTHAPSRPNNLYPIALEVAEGKHPYLNIFGTDYPTPDGTAIRDYIHVQDLAEGHVAVAETLLNTTKGCCEIYNLGTGRGTSVKEFVETFNKVRSTNLPIHYTERRSGDVGISVADVSKAKNVLGWSAKRTLEDCLMP